MAEANASGAGRNDLGEGRSQHRLVVHIYRNEATRVEKSNWDKSVFLCTKLVARVRLPS